MIRRRVAIDRVIFGRLVRVGLRRGEWWIGVRSDFPLDALEINFFGLTVFVSNK